MKSTTLYTCSHCDAQFQKWVGRCLECGKWGTVNEQYIAPAKKGVVSPTAPATPVVKLKDIQGTDVKRIPTTVGELDRVLGGGVVPGSLVLLGGEPGIGKSTLSIQLATIVQDALYVSGEESVGQIKLRADRLGLKADSLKLANETNVETVCATIRKEKPALVVIDSIQTIHSHDASGEAGTPSQIRACTVRILEVAKSLNIATIIIGHVTKEGSVAGPKTLEHLVDTVLYLEGDRHHAYRILRTVKNRFGSTDEIGIFDMQETGLKEVANPSMSFLEERGEPMPGSVITCLLEGTRPLLVEVQALVNKTAFGYPQRKASGFDLNRLHVLLAVLERRAGLPLGQFDVHLNIVGGIKAHEPAADLAVCLAVASAFKDTALGKDLVVFGEVGLGGEIRSIRQTDKRLRECAQLGMKRVITRIKKSPANAGLKLIDVKNIAELLKQT